MRIEHLQHGFGEEREVVVESFVNACCEQREGLDHALDVGISGLITSELKLGGNFGKRLGKLPSV